MDVFLSSRFDYVFSDPGCSLPKKKNYVCGANKKIIIISKIYFNI